ncbi:MAG: flagellar basal body-associated FliL family protein [Rhodospirillales bacterium]|nr:flagellar basal body-associated FliL family protein [Alphaproteobacteria bacterium]MBL6948604.1 flagellar basal body-associated FliL family protein [Rhodospirillales bacterium]
MSEEPDEAEVDEEAAESAEAGEDAEGEVFGEDDEDGEDSGQAPKKGGKKKLVLIIAAAVVVLAGVGGGAAWYFGLLDSMLGGKSPTKKAVLELSAPVRHELPMIKADLKTGKCRSPLVRTVIVIEIEAKDVALIQAMQLRITDALTTYFRDKERHELVGKAGSDKFRYDATRILNNLIAPSRVHSLLFKEFIIQ